MSTIHACLLCDGNHAEQLVQYMLKASAYWQPDKITRASTDNGHCALAKAALFNCVGSQTDSVYEDLPSGQIISANARIDNREVLGRALRLTADETQTLSNSELILRAYQRWGKDCPAQILGDFVFIIWDPHRQRMFCARDHFGVKILYYAKNHQGIMVSNEHNAFFSADWLPKIISESWLVKNLWLANYALSDSPCDGIEVLPPAHSLSFENNKTELRQYWRLKSQNISRSADSNVLLKELKTRFQRAVERRLDSQYPLGSELSEGLDSNAIAGYAAASLNPQKLYSLSHFCEQLTPQNHQHWDQAYQDLQGMWELHPNIQPLWRPANSHADYFVEIGHYQRFFQHYGAALPLENADGLFLFSELAAQSGIRTLLSGWGGDHCVSFPGYFYESELLRQGRLVALHRHFRNVAAAEAIHSPAIKPWLKLLLKHFLPSLHKLLALTRGTMETHYQHLAKQHWLKPLWQDKYGLNNQLKAFLEQYQNHYSVQSGEHRELFEIGVERRLMESELCSRHSRIEYRFPMLDVELVEFAHNIPGDLKIHNGIKRWHFRQILEGVTSPRNQWRRKPDVNLPWNLFEAIEHERSMVLQQAVYGNKLLPRYCDIHALDNPADPLPLPVLRPLLLFTYYGKTGDIEIR